MIFCNSTLLMAAARFFPTLTAVSADSISHQKLGWGDILMQGALAGIWQVVKSTTASIGLVKRSEPGSEDG